MDLEGQYQLLTTCMIRGFISGVFVFSSALVLGSCSSEVDEQGSEESGSTLAYEITGEFDRDLAACMIARDWDVEPVAGGISFEGSGEDSYEEFQADNDECLIEIGYDSERYYADEYLAADFASRLEQASCYERAGFTISEPPTVATYIEQTQITRMAYWAPDVEARENYGDIPHSVWNECQLPEPWEIEVPGED